jgi:hypothetical protein
MTETLCTSGAVKHKAGANASTTITEDAVIMTEFINQAEGDFIAATGVNWVDIYSTMNADYKQTIENAVSCRAAVYVVNYDMSGFTSRQEAIHMINVLWATYQEGARILKEEKNSARFGASKITS